MTVIRIGVSGWSYDDWRNGGFYPRGLPRNRELSFVSRHFNSAEINGSFYSLLRPETYENYRDIAPDGFRYAVKGSRFITHNKKLKDVKTPLANFFASGLLRLEDKLGPILWQLPHQSWEMERVETFLDLLPDDGQAASRLAKRHDQRVTGHASMLVHENRAIRHALEVRHENLLTEAMVRLCRQHRVPLVISHNGGDWPCIEELTADFVYVRLHGAPDTYASRYRDSDLDYWADRIRAWNRGTEPADSRRITARKPPRRSRRDVYVYFDNDQQAHAPADARRLMDRLDVKSLGEWDDERNEVMR